MTIQDLRKKYFKKIDPLDFDLILEKIIKKPRSFVLAHPDYPITNYKLKITNFLKRRAKGEPLAYILGHKEFYGLDFKVNKNVLVPRPETEMMVEEALKLTSDKKTFIDIGTGSGCIITTLANFKPGNAFFGIDISSEALGVARQNAKAHGVYKKIKFIKGNLLKPIMGKRSLNIRSQVIILANLPYVPTEWKRGLKTKDTQGLKFEPRAALYSGKDGLDHYRRLAEQLKILKAKTAAPITLFCEIGHEQAAGIKKIFTFAKKIEIKKDHNCYYRLVMAEI